MTMGHVVCSLPRQPGLTITLRPTGHVLPRRRRPRFACRAEDGKQQGGDSIEQAFQQELERRKAAAAAGKAPGPGAQAGSSSGSDGGFRSSSAAPPPPFAGSVPDTPSQLAQSRALNSEGLEGLIPRATELIKLAVAFTLSYGPFILVVVLSFYGVYSIFGDAFIHGGRPGTELPAYIDPEELLKEGPPMTPFIIP